MDTIGEIGGAALGAAIGVGCAWVLAGVVRDRGAWLFWLVAFALFSLGIASVAVGIAFGISPLVWGGSALPLAAVTTLKWRSGLVPGVSAARDDESEVETRV